MSVTQRGGPIRALGEGLKKEGNRQKKGEGEKGKGRFIYVPFLSSPGRSAWAQNLLTHSRAGKRSFWWDREILVGEPESFVSTGFPKGGQIRCQSNASYLGPKKVAVGTRGGEEDEVRGDQ